MARQIIKKRYINKILISKTQYVDLGSKIKYLICLLYFLKEEKKYNSQKHKLKYP